MRTGIAFAVLAVALGLGWFQYSKVTQARRESAYHAALSPFQRDLRLGMSRADAEKYLHARSVDYHAINFGETYLVKIGEEPPSNLWCEEWQVYIALEFGSADELTNVHIRKIGTCL